MEDIGKLIKEQRKRQRLSQAELGKRVGLGRNTVSGIESGTIQEVGIRKVESLLNALGYTLVAQPLRRRPTLGELTETNPHEA